MLYLKNIFLPTHAVSFMKTMARLCHLLFSKIHKHAIYRRGMHVTLKFHDTVLPKTNVIKPFYLSQRYFSFLCTPLDL